MSRRGQRSNHPPNSGSDNDFSDVSDFGSDQDNSEGEGEDLMDADMFRADQRRDAVLDNYDETLLGDSSDEEQQYGYHQQMTRELDQRDQQAQKRRKGHFLLGQAGEDSDPLMHSEDDLHYLIEPTGDDLPLHELNIPADQLLAQPRAPETIKKLFLKLFRL